MLDRTLEILTSYPKPRQVCEMGNIAVARGAIEAGVGGVFSYPGTPSTEISEVFKYVNEFQNRKNSIDKYPEQSQHRIYFEYSINEKIALEKAIAFSIGNKSALCVMKSVGMNVAADALMSISYQTIVAPLVIVVCDDPGCHSSSNEQDSRHWGPMASVPVFNPATPEDAREMVIEAFKLSAEIQLPVIVRTTTRVSHSRGIFSYGEFQYENRTAEFIRSPDHINIPARTALAHIRLLDKLKHKSVLTLQKKNSRLLAKGAKTGLGIICSGVAVAYVNEIIHNHDLVEKVNVMDLGMVHPFPEKEALHFLNMGHKKILILEELDPLVENSVRALAQKNKLTIEIFGKEFAGISTVGEFSIDLITEALESFTQINFNNGEYALPENSSAFLQSIPPRPPALCAGCPHRATFYLLKLAIPREQSEMILCGDIGCFGLGALPPLKMIDTINHMGMSISMAQGLFESFNTDQNDDKIVALVGDGTFFHSGLTSIVNALYTRANILVVIFDNRTIGMTGHQSHPGASTAPKYHEIDIPPLLKGLGIEFVETIDPFDIKDGLEKVDKAMLHKGVSVVISKSPCIFLPEFDVGDSQKRRIVVDPNRCNTCGNHEDISMHCSRCYAPKSNLSRAKAKLIAGISVPGDEQLCPANICNHGFFNSVLEGDYKSAVEVVRDKMLFARTCGDICHRPCELFSERDAVVPIKALKKFATSFDEHFEDFSQPRSRARNSYKNNMSVAIIGAGPSGLSAAYDLVQAGYQVDIYERETKAGGMVTYGIPSFRMDKSGFDFEAMQLEEMGVAFHFNTALGADISLQKLSAENNAVVLAIGMGKSKSLEIVDKNIPIEKRTDALSFLKLFNTHEEIDVDQPRVLVIGGGNSAMDAARAAKRSKGVTKVFVSCLETFETMPAFQDEVHHAENEEIEFIYDSYVDKCAVSSNGTVNISLAGARSEKFLQTLECDYVITAIGQLSDSDALRGIGKKSMDEGGRIRNTNGLSKKNNVFTAGDILSGNSMSVIGAIASGKKAAADIRQFLEAYPYQYEGAKALEILNTNPLSHARPKADPLVEANIREEVEKFDLQQPCMKCNHCIDNFGCPSLIKVNGKVEIDYSSCTLCGLCIDVCPNDAIKWEVLENEAVKVEVVI